MKKLSFILFFLMSSSLLLAGNHDKLVGNWKFDVDKFKNSKEYKDAAKDPQQGKMMKMMLGILSQTEFKFTKDSTIMTMPDMTTGKKRTEKAKYTVSSDKGKVLKIKSSKGPVIITFLNDKNIKVKDTTPGNPVSVMFLKKN